MFVVFGGGGGGGMVEAVVFVVVGGVLPICGLVHVLVHVELLMRVLLVCL